MLSFKISTFLVGMLLLLPFAITFWLMAFRDSANVKAELKKSYDQAIADMRAQDGATGDPSSDAQDATDGEPSLCFFAVRVEDAMNLPKVPYQIWTFFPRRWVGLVCITLLSILWFLSSFVPALTYSGPPPSAPASSAP